MSILSKFKPISISLSPNVEKDDVILVLKLILRPWQWKQGEAILELKERFKKYFGVKHAFSFNSGRSSFYAILNALNLEKGSDVMIQAFTCNAVPNPILWTGLNPIYVDCDNNYNISLESLKSKILNHKSVIVVQHTFGLPANIKEILKICKDNNLILIEDCAHALGAEFEGKKLCTFSDVAFFSFSRDKVISSVYGGMVVTNNDEIAKKLSDLQKKFGSSSYAWIFQQLLHPILLYFFILPLYNFLDLGKIFLVFSQWFHILSKAVSFKEKRGLRPDYFPKNLPNALSILALNQFSKLEKFNAHRKKIAEFYYDNLKGTQFALPEKENNIFLRFAVKHNQAHDIIYEAWHDENMLLGDWYTNPIAPDDTNLEKMKYKIGMCPNAEELSKVTLNLPTHINISFDDAKRVVNFLKKYK